MALQRLDTVCSDSGTFLRAFSGDASNRVILLVLWEPSGLASVKSLRLDTLAQKFAASIFRDNWRG